MPSSPFGQFGPSSSLATWQPTSNGSITSDRLVRKVRAVKQNIVQSRFKETRHILLQETAKSVSFPDDIRNSSGTFHQEVWEDTLVSQYLSSYRVRMRYWSLSYRFEESLYEFNRHQRRPPLFFVLKPFLEPTKNEHLNPMEYERIGTPRNSGSQKNFF